jgi:heparan-sulfate lyase
VSFLDIWLVYTAVFATLQNAGKSNMTTDIPNAFDEGFSGLELFTQDEGEYLVELLQYYRTREVVWCLPEGALNAEAPASTAELARAEDTLKHIIVPSNGMLDLYSAHDYGLDIDWDADPNQNRNWVAHVHRFFWDQWLASAYLTSHDERFAAGWIRLAGDWIEKDTNDWKSFAYMPLQIGVRSIRWSADFELYKNSPEFTPQFLKIFLTAIHSQAEKTTQHPSRKHVNATIVEAVGLLHISIVFPEFKGAKDWFRAALKLMDETVAAQVTSDGVHAEWGINYHIGVMHWLLKTTELLEKNRAVWERWKTTDSNGINAGELADRLRHKAEQMCDLLLAALSPDRQYPMFSDARRPSHNIQSALRRGNEVFDKPHYRAILDENEPGYPAERDYCYSVGGMYFFRSGWGRNAIYMAIHCSPPSASSHDQPDNGTFELFAFGEWLMPDSGCYAYGHGQPEAAERNWFRQTSVHQTLTLNNENSVNAPEHLFFHSSEELAVVSFQNASYPEFVHRRTIFFIDRAWFVFLDEAFGDAEGDLDLHFQLAPGQADFDFENNSVRSLLEAANVLIRQSTEIPVHMIEEKGQVSFLFHEKESRPAFSFRHEERKSAFYLTAIIPYCGTAEPEVRLKLATPYEAAGAKVEFDINVDSVSRRVSLDRSSNECVVL